VVDGVSVVGATTVRCCVVGVVEVIGINGMRVVVVIVAGTKTVVVVAEAW
jgi:hypothetical protein